MEMNDLQKNKSRNPGIDILKVLLAVMVIIIHINASNTGAVAINMSGTLVKIVVQACMCLCYPAVNTYILITALFTNYKKENRYNAYKKAIILWLTLIFYSLSGYFLLNFGEKLSVFQLINRMFPLSNGQWWFYTCYICLILISPFINLFVDEIDRKIHFNLCIILLLITSVIPFLAQWNDKIMTGNGYSLIWFICLYISGRYILKYDDIQKGSFLKYFAIYISLSAFLFLSALLTKIPVIRNFNLYSYNSIVVFLQAVCLISAFKRISLDSAGSLAKMMSWGAELAMGSYLFHCQMDVEKRLWSMLNMADSSHSLLILVPKAILVVVGILICGLIAEIVRKYIFRLLKVNTCVDRIIKMLWICNRDNNE